VPIQIKCPSCAAAFRAPDNFAGKRVKCPKCQGTIAVPTAAGKTAEPRSAAQPSTQQKPSAQKKTPEKPKPSAAPKPAASTKPAPTKPAPTKQTPVKQEPDQWYVQTDDGEQYGPVSKDELHEWIAEGRLDATCQVLCDGWEQWQWAEDVFDELSKTEEPAAEENPFAGIGDTTPPAESINPFESPQTSASPTVTDAAPTEGGITPVMRQALAETRPWVLFLSILGFVAGGFGVLACLGGLVMAMLAMGVAAIVPIIMMLVSAALTGLYIYAAYLLFSYASQISKFLQSHQTQQLERALVAQKSFWKLVGIVTPAAIGLELLLFLIAMMAGGLAVVG